VVGLVLGSLREPRADHARKSALESIDALNAGDALVRLKRNLLIYLELDLQ
jgi:hypothetical protein